MGRRVSPRIFFVTQLFDPEPTFRGLKFARALSERGFDVEVVTGFPNYPGGKLYDGYRIQPVTHETMDGVSVTRLAIYPYHGANAIRRAFAYVSFMISALLYLVLNARRYDTIYVFYPALTAGYAAILAKVIRGSRVVLDIQDMWPDSLEATGMVRGRWVNRVLSVVCRLQYRLVDQIVVLSEGFRDLIVSRGAASQKITVIYNWADETPSATSGEIPDGFNASDEFRVLFAGNMGAAQGLDAVLDAAGLVLRERPGVRFYFLGSGIEKERLQKQAQVLGDAVVFLPRVPLGKVQNYLVSADCLLVHLRPDPLFAITIPSKTQAYLYAGRPVLMAVEGEAAELVEGCGAGVSARPGDPPDIARAVVALCGMTSEQRKRMGEAGRTFYDARLSFERGVAAFEEMLRTDRTHG